MTIHRRALYNASILYIEGGAHFIPNLEMKDVFTLVMGKDQPMIGSDIGSGRFLAISVKHRIGKI